MGGNGSGGSNRKPYQLHELGGTLRARQERRLSDLPAGSFGRARRPSWLRGEARRFWNEHAPQLEARGLLDALSQMPFALVCASWGHLREAEALLAREGAVVTGPRGGQRAHPAVKQAKDWRVLFMAGCKDFGLTPLSRQRMPAPPAPAAVDDFERFFGRTETAAPAPDPRGYLAGVTSGNGAQP